MVGRRISEALQGPQLGPIGPNVYLLYYVCIETLTCGMLALETKQSGGKLPQHSDLRGGEFPGEASRSRQRGLKIGTWNMWTGLDWPRIETGGGRLSAVMNLRVP